MEYSSRICFTLKTAVIFLILFGFYMQTSEGVWSSQCWKKHNSGSIQTPDGEFKRPFGILCTYQCFLWFPPVFPYCEFIFDLRMSRHFTVLPDCYTIHCNETFTFFNEQPSTSV